MRTEIERPSGAQWLEMVGRYPELRDPGHRRSEPRRVGPFGSTRLAFEEGGWSAVLDGRLLNASGAGVMLNVKREIPLGTIVMLQVTLEDEIWQLAGCVTHCTQTVGGYKIGIELHFERPKN